MTETAVPSPAEIEEIAEASVETPAPVPAPAPKAPPRSGGERPTQPVGRRKQAIVRVRLVPGTGKITCNNRELERYLPSKVAQQAVREPLVIADKAEVVDVIANLRGG